MNRPLPESRRTVLVFIMVISFRFDRPDGRIAAKRRKIVARGEGLVEDEHEPLVKKGVEGAPTGAKENIMGKPFAPLGAPSNAISYPGFATLHPGLLSGRSFGAIQFVNRHS
jgi:hypothetical protein